MTPPSGQPCLLGTLSPAASVSAVPAVDVWRPRQIMSLTVVAFISQGLQRPLPSR